MTKQTKTVKQLSYQERLLQSQEEKDQQEVSSLVREADLNVQSDILQTEKSLAIKRRVLEAAKGEFPLNTQTIISLQVEVEALEDGLKRLEALRKELF